MLDREHILSEIRRCAAVNGGVPLGRQRFEAATGIRESDWAGRYWVRWSEAVDEAGLATNLFNQAHSEDHLLRQLALLVRELGRFPVRAELDLRRRQDAAFPSAKTFERFGNKEARIAKLVEYCASDPTLSGVYEICAPLITPQPMQDEATDAPSGRTDGYVYLVKSGKHYKIGRSNSAGRRFYEIGLQLPEELKVIHHVQTDDPVGIERYWHERFANKRANGEWFALTSEDVKAFKRRRTFM
jgi:hypothetical protein